MRRISAQHRTTCRNWLAVATTICALTIPAQGAIPQSEREALIALYNSTNGAGWTNNTGWLGAPGTECSWFGLSCTGDSIELIQLHSNGLSGSIPAALGQLGALKSLSLSSNQLNGSIPPELGQLGCIPIRFEDVSDVGASGGG